MSASADDVASGDRRKLVAARRIKKAAVFLDDSIRIPGTSKTIGWDGLVGLVPGIGDLATAFSSSYVIVTAAKAGIPVGAVVVMVGRLCIDTVVGLLPVFGDVFDFVYKANRRNAQTAIAYLDPDGVLDRECQAEI